MAATPNFCISAGTYERVLFGYDFQVPEKIPASPLPLQSRYMCAPHFGCIKSLASHSKGLLLSGSTDGSFKAYNLKRNLQIDSLTHHKAAVTCLEFIGNSHFIVGSEDNTLSVWTQDGDFLLSLVGHKGPVYSVSVHPSNKLALSTSKDGTLKLWNLINGKCDGSFKLESPADTVKFSPDGKIHVLIHDTVVAIRDLEGETKHRIKRLKRVIAITFVTDTVFAIGGEDKSITFIDSTTGKDLATIPAHTNRIKALVTVPGTDYIASASSDGFIKVWHVDKSKWSNLKCVAQVSTDARLVCMTCCQVAKMTPKEKKISRKQDEEEEDEVQVTYHEADNDNDQEEQEEPQDENEQEEEEEEEVPPPKASILKRKPSNSNNNEDNQSNDNYTSKKKQKSEQKKARFSSGQSQASKLKSKLLKKKAHK